MNNAQYWQQASAENLDDFKAWLGFPVKYIMFGCVNIDVLTDTGADEFEIVVVVHSFADVNKLRRRELGAFAGICCKENTPLMYKMKDGVEVKVCFFGIP